METAEKLIQHIKVKRQHLRQLEDKLGVLQAQCAHEYVEIRTHRKCLNCLKVESVHY